MKATFLTLPLAAALGVGLAGPAAGQGAIRVVRAQMPVRLAAPTPSYPDELKRARIEGIVIVEARIDTTGMVELASVKVIESPDLRFDEPAKEFVLKSRYRPARVDGRSIPMYVRVPVLFDLRPWR
jgi:TonB family protein